MNEHLTRERLMHLLHYDEGTGVFIRRVSLPGYRAGSSAGTVDDRGYVVIKIDGKSYKSHRLAWLYVNGDWPKGEIDHEDGDTQNNSFNNLRDATHSQNMANCRLYKNNSSGLKGVAWHKASGKWISYIQVDKKRIHLGLFYDPNEAHKKFLKASAELHGKFARAA